MNGYWESTIEHSDSFLGLYV